MGFPWNSVLHTKCALFFIAGIKNSDSEVLSHFFETMKLVAVIASAVEKKEDVGYLGAFIQIAESIEKCGKGAGKEWDAFCERVLYPLLQKKAAFEQLRHCFVWGKHASTHTNYIIQQPQPFLSAEALADLLFSAILIALSNTSFRPTCVFAEHSM